MQTPQESDKTRQFFCPCGKGYYSYAALFTHIKQKHDGKPPGSIIKPKPEHKRGRPRKTPPPLENGKQVEGKEGGGCEGRESCLPAANLNQIGNNIKVITANPPLKCSPGSQFKSYKAEASQEPTLHELPHESASQVSLLEDLTSNLIRLSPAKIQGDALQQIQAKKLLSEGGRGQLVECLSNFICFCREGLRQDIAAQIQLLITALLQHVCEKRDGVGSVRLLKHIHLNDYIETFFEKLKEYARRWHLQDEPIFQGLNPMKILVVLYNWINSVYNIPAFPKQDLIRIDSSSVSHSFLSQSQPQHSHSHSHEEQSQSESSSLVREEGLSLSC